MQNSVFHDLFSLQKLFAYDILAEYMSFSNTFMVLLDHILHDTSSIIFLNGDTSFYS